MNEEVLVVKAASLTPNLNEFSDGFLEFPKQEMVDGLVNDAFYMDRAAAEVDPTHKQLIPYCLLLNKNNLEEAFAYQRTKMAGETRLHGKWSVGIGGHINPCDEDSSDNRYFAGLKRELKEEIGYDLHCPTCAPIVGLLYDDSNEVGQVHLGVIHAIKVAPDTVKSDDPSISHGRFINMKDLKSFDLENWSKILINKINET